MENSKKYTINNDNNNVVEDVNVKYNSQKDFTTLEAWRKARLVKLFFYKEVIPLLPIEERQSDLAYFR